MKWRNYRNSVRSLNASGIVQETNVGTLILCSASDGNAKIYRSVDFGISWNLQQIMSIPSAGTVGVRGSFVDSRGHIYVGGRTSNCTYENYGNAYFGEIWKSSDDGVSWSKACTSECSGFWHFTEDSTGCVYVNEYTETPPSGTEYPAVNIWKSDSSGNNFAKWHTIAKETSPGARDGVRHIHTVYVDAADKVYVCYGDTGWTGYAGHVVRLNAAGNIDLDYGRFGNGSTAAIHNDRGTILVGKDNNPSGIDALHPTIALSCMQCNLQLNLGQRYDSYIFDMFRSNDDVLFGLTSLGSRYNAMLYSVNDGDTWNAIDFGGSIHVAVTHNKNAPSGMMFFSGAVKYMPVPTRIELSFRHPNYFPRE